MSTTIGLAGPKTLARRRAPLVETAARGARGSSASQLRKALQEKAIGARCLPDDPRMRVVLASVLLAVGCGPRPAGDLDSSSGATDAVESEDTGESGDDGTADTGALPPGESGGEDPAICGDGIVEGAEECDDANDEPEDGCEADCRHTPGTLLWEYARPAGFANGLSLAVGDDGSVFVAGAQRDGEQDLRWTARLTPTGVVDWESTAPIELSVSPRGIVPTGDGGVVITSEERTGGDGEPIVWQYFWAQYDAEGQEIGRIMDPELHHGASPPPIIADGEGGFFTAPRFNPDEELYIEHWSAFGELISSARVDPPREEAIGAYALALLEDGRLLMAGFERSMESPEGVQCSAEGWGKSDRYAAVIDTEGTIHAEAVLDRPEACVESFSHIGAFEGGWIVQGGRTYATFAPDGTLLEEYGSPQLAEVEDFAVWHAAVDSRNRLVLGGADGFPSWESVDGVVVAYDTGGEPRFTAIMEGHRSLVSDWGGTRVSGLAIAPDDDVIVAGYRTLDDGLEAELFIRRYAN